MKRLACTLALAAGCGGAPFATAKLSNTAPTFRTGVARYTIGTHSLGPITAETPVNLTDLSALVNKDGLTVRELNPPDSGPELHVLLGDELLFFVHPDPEDDETLKRVFVTSGKIQIEQHPEWKIGEPFAGDHHLTHCECWGEHPVCFKKGDHVAVGFERSCDGLDSPASRKALVGVIVQRAVWSPIPYKDEDEAQGGALGDGLGD